MTSGEKAEPERSAISSTDCRHCLTHPLPGPHTDGKCCLCGITREVLDEPEPQDVHKGPPCSGCGHPQHSQRCSKMTSLGEDEMGHCGCIELTALNDIIETCRRAGGCPMHPVLKDVRPTERAYLKCRCGHFQQTHRPSTEGGCRGMACDCDGFKLAPNPEEPPLTPEEEEEASEDTPCSEVEGCDGNCCAKAPPPPQPDRRPPYLLAYSVQGHLYEVALSGDATVATLDGRLVITHSLGPVAGICQIAPITNEESTR